MVTAKDRDLHSIIENGARGPLQKSVSVYAECMDGKSHLSWCVWEQEYYGYLAPIYLKDAGKISNSKAIGPDLRKVIEAIAPNQVIYMDDDPLIKSAMKSLAAKGWKERWSHRWLHHTLMSDETLVTAKEALSHERFQLPKQMGFEPDLIFDEEFELCLLQDDAVKHNNIKLLLSKACAVGCLYFHRLVNSQFWR